jgi:hypothetical protein
MPQRSVFVFFNLNKFSRSIDRFIYVDYLFVGSRLDTCRMITSSVRRSARGEGRLLSLGVMKLFVSLLLRFASNPRGFCDDDNRQLVQGGCGKQ